ncbi:AAA domain-containing protein [Metabacillus sp. JX24]|uniref:AAA domain-containing protein n=1 Tax=Metabacillus sp. JX24 TaxID=3240759 RepID=UPI003510CA6C
MNIEQHLILIKEKEKTREIDSIQYLDSKWCITYNSNPKSYNYGYHNVTWYRNPDHISAYNKIIFENDNPLSGVTKIIRFDEYIRILFDNGFYKLYPASKIKVENNQLQNKNTLNCLTYLKKVADHVSVNDGDLSFLSKQYHYLDAISPRSVLSVYLESGPFAKGTLGANIIYPFGFNLSQKKAVEKSMVEQVSLIEGPPGTGKTQTILNIISNAILNGKTVAVVSNNNSATANVFEKLQKYGVDFIAAYLGNASNKDQFFSGQNNSYPNMESWILTSTEYQEIQVSIVSLEKNLNDMLKRQNELAKVRQERSALQTEYEYFLDYYSGMNVNDTGLKIFLKYSSKTIQRFLVEYKRAAENGKLTLWNKIRNMFTFGMLDFRVYKYSESDVIGFLHKTFYSKKLFELQNQIEELQENLHQFNFEKSMREYTLASMRLFKAKLAERYKGQNRKVFSSDVLWKNFGHFIKEYPVVLSTTHSLRNCAAKNYLFDYVIVDEASQVDIVTGALALSCAKNAVVVGDLKQLPNVVPSEVAAKTNEIFNLHSLNEGYRYSENSLLSSFLTLYKDVPKTLLKEHYRCHPQIIGFCNQKYYNNELVILTENEQGSNPLTLYKTVKGNHARGTYNQRQIDVIFNEVLPAQNLKNTGNTIGIISPYRAQTNHLIRAAEMTEIEADTVHKFQGREKDVVILSTVVNDMKKGDFADNSNLINVAVSRAVKELILVVSDGSDEWKGTNIGDLVRYIKYNNFDVVESRIYSVFDLLYSHYSAELLSVLKNPKTKKNSIYTSEVLMNIVIENVICGGEFDDLDYVLHQPLKMLIKDLGLLTIEEKKYALNILTHVDFVIFSKVDKMPVLAVEVDGHAFHHNNPVQLKRDNMKDEILKKYNIPIIRMRTTGSGEEEKLQEKLRGILNMTS